MPGKPAARLIRNRTISARKKYPKQKRRKNIKRAVYFLIFNGKANKLDKRKKYIIGRSNDCDIQIIKPEVSRHHASIKWNSASKVFVFKDLNSYNGSLINAKSVLWGELKNGDIINLARNKMYFEEKSTKAPEKKVLPPPTNKGTVMLEQKLSGIMRIVDDTLVKDRIQEYHKLIIAMRKNLALLAYHDQTTGLFNRRYFNINIEREIKMSRRSKNSVSLTMIDIDNFKKFNDTYGHQKGDDVLEGVGGFIRSAIRETDIACRYGGEEMAVILPNTTTDHAIKVAEKIRKKVASFSQKQFGVKVTISLGIATITAKCKSTTQLIAAADEALYKAKEEGRNRCVSC